MKENNAVTQRLKVIDGKVKVLIGAVAALGTAISKARSCATAGSR